MALNAVYANDVIAKSVSQNHNNQVEDLTENRDILNENTISVFLENVVSITGEACTDFYKYPFKQKVASGTGGYLVFINKENLLVKTNVCFFAFLRLQMRCKFLMK